MLHRVFVSSTFLDLTEHRKSVQEAIRQLGAIDVSMENFGARDERPKAECLRLIQEESDSFIGVYAHRYGYIPKGERKSITEAEYDAAIGTLRQDVEFQRKLYTPPVLTRRGDRNDVK
jgi:hypothetical protein